MTRLPDGLEHLPVDDLPTEIPLDWSAEQALAALEWLGELRDRVWLLYASDIQELLHERNSGGPSSQDDELPL